MFKFFVSSFLTTVWLLSHSAFAKELSVAFELPRFETADYHKPYVAIWTESAQKSNSLLLWHLNARSDDKWLVDIRRWWRKLGRYDEKPDGFTGATRGPGKYEERFTILEDQAFTLFIEVVREDGGRSLLKQKIDFSTDQIVYTLPADKEVGEITITLGNNS